MLTYNLEAGSAVQQSELAGKISRIEKILSDNNLDALIINSQRNFAWATAGANNWVAIADDRGASQAIFRADGSRYIVTENIEAPRMGDEEKLKSLGFEITTINWWESGDRNGFLLDVAGGVNKTIGCDTTLGGTTDISAELNTARWSLLPEERDRYRLLGQAAGDALEEVCMGIVPGDTEWTIGGYLAKACYARGILPIVTLVAADERIFQHRHPIPTHKAVERYAMVVLCARAGGLIASCTRLVHFGPVPPEIMIKQRELQTIDAVFNIHTKPGATAGDIFQKAVEAYAYAGYPDEWQLHHQGGATGYGARDYRAGPGSPEVVQEWQAFAWNPSITGTKSEDTILVSSEPGHELEVLTAPAGSSWPTATVTIEGIGAMQRPEILEK
jgi:Xaa-Pro aminopeptidase